MWQTGEPTGILGKTDWEAEIETKLDEIAARAIDIIANYSRMSAADISRDTTFDEIDVSSLELTEIVMDLEDVYGIEVDLNATEAWDALKNVGDVVNTIHKLVSARN